MKNKEFYKLLKKNKSNSGFTLTELLVGLFMSIFVIGALGFGLMTVLATSQSETSKVKARTENSRALDFISDEVRRARNIETNVTSANVSGTGGTFSLTGKTPVFALDIPEINSRGKIVYYLKSTGLGNWKGPQVLYRWGPPLDANGNYTTGDWNDQALIDGINDTTVSSPCTTSGVTVTPATPKGFYACITGTNTAQLFLTGQTKTANGVNDDSQTNDSKVVARARTRAANTTSTFTSVNWSVKGLGGQYECSRSATSATLWNMRTDFGNDSAHPDNTTKWIKDSDNGKQPQPIEVDSSKALTITSSAIGPGTGCNSIGNSGKDGSELLSTYPTNLKISHTVNFGNPITFNGDIVDGSPVYNVSQVDSNKPTVRFLKKGDVPLLGGYVANPNSPSANDQPSLGKFLYNQKMAIIDPNYTWPAGKTLTQVLIDPNTKFIIPTDAQLTADTNLTAAEKEAFVMLGNDQRIVAVEVGQTNTKLADGTTNNPGFDLQDNIFVVTSDIFTKKFPASSFP